MDYSGKLHEFILQVTSMKLELNELNQQLEKLNNPESSVDEKYYVLTWIAENVNNVDIAKLIENGVVQNIHFESALLFNVYHFDYRFYEMVNKLFPMEEKIDDNDTLVFSIVQMENMIDFVMSYVRYHSYDELGKYFKSKFLNLDEADLVNYINSLETFMNKVQSWFANSFYCTELPAEVYINEFKKRIVNEMSILIPFGLMEEDGVCYDDSYC